MIMLTSQNIIKEKSQFLVEKKTTNSRNIHNFELIPMIQRSHLVGIGSF